MQERLDICNFMISNMISEPKSCYQIWYHRFFMIWQCMKGWLYHIMYDIINFCMLSHMILYMMLMMVSKCVWYHVLKIWYLAYYMISYLILYIISCMISCIYTWYTAKLLKTVLWYHKWFMISWLMISLDDIMT